jgi:hypothetical protein
MEVKSRRQKGEGKESPATVSCGAPTVLLDVVSGLFLGQWVFDVVHSGQSCGYTGSNPSIMGNPVVVELLTGCPLR